MADPKYRLEMAIWRLKIAAQADKKTFDRAKAEEQVHRDEKTYGANTNYWAARAFGMGLLLLALLYALVSKHLPFLPTLQ